MSADDFYDRLAPHYHLLFGDWERAVVQQGQALDALLAALGVARGEPVLDAACGIGTQALGLAMCGHRVSASDLSAQAVARLAAEANARGLAVPARVDDLRHLAQAADASQAAVLACDNSLPHLLTDAELLQALRAAWRCLRPGGVLVLSVRDYAAMRRVNPEVRPYGLHRSGNTRFVAVQVWEWDGDCYDLRLYLTTEHPDGRCSTERLTSRYYAVSLQRLSELLAEAGFAEVQRRDDVLFQPVLSARRPA